MNEPAETNDTVEATTVVSAVSRATAEAFQRFTSQVQLAREDLLALTMSGLGGCSRQGAYRLARTPPSEDTAYGQMREANIGTMIHTGLLPHLAAVLDGVEEVPVTLRSAGLVINGRTDLYSSSLRLVADLKTVGQHRMASLGPTASHPHRMQVGGYALGIEQAGYPVESIAWIYLDRSSGQDRVVIEPFDDDVRSMITNRCEELATYAVTPEAAPRDERGPGLSIICDQCPWLRECWGQDASPGRIGAQRVLCHDNAAVEQAIAGYKQAAEREREARSEKEFYRAMFSSFDAGAYGEWEFGWSTSGKTDDKEAAVAFLNEAGIPLPKRETPRRLIVKRAQPPEAG